MSPPSHVSQDPVLRLVRNTFFSLSPQHAMRLELLSGRVWVTQSGDPDDHFLSGTQALALRIGSRVLIGAETDTSFQLLPRRPHAARPAPQAAATVPG